MDALAQAASHGNAFLLTGTEDTYHLLDRPDPALLDRTIPADRPEAWRTLDATVLHSTLLGDVWGIPEDSPPTSRTSTTRRRRSTRRATTAALRS